MAVLLKIIQLVLSLSLLVIVHEFGHFIAARIFKTRVEKFYMFFDAGFALMKFKKINGKWNFKFFCKNQENDDWKTDDDCTEFGIGWIPLGGYCKIAGMIDESMDLEQMKREPQPWEFRSKPAWQRLIIMVGGVFMNVVMAFIIYIGLLSSYGEQYLPTSEVNKYGISVDSLAYNFGLRNGDKILSVNGKYVEDFHQIPMELVLEKAKDIEVEREGRKITVELPDDALAKLLKLQSSFISFRFPFVIGDFADKSAARDAGLQANDIIIKINDIATPYYQDFIREIKSFAGQEISLTVLRDIDTMQYAMRLPEESVIGVYTKQMLEIKTKDYTFWEAIPRGFSKTGKELSDYWKQVKLIFNPSTKAYESLGGFISIGSIFPASFEWYQFWRLTAFLSIILAVMNILPIPALDGGHVLFLLFEIITRRKPSDKFMEKAQVVGLVILFALLIFANGNDIVKLFR